MASNRFNLRFGFTLAELLLVIIILGGIAAFGVNKIVVAEQTQKERALFKRTYAAMSEVLREGVLRDRQYNAYKYLQDIATKMNAVKVCTTDSVTNGCWSSAQRSAATEGLDGGFVLANGVNGTGLVDDPAVTDGAEYMLIDLNGPTEPNLTGVDTLYLVICFRSTYSGCTTWPDPAYTGKKTAGAIAPGWGATNYQMYLRLIH